MINGLNLSLHFGNKHVLNDISISILPSEVLVVCGPNGAGKSTLLSALVGDHKSLINSVIYEGVRLGGMSPQILAKKRAVLEQTPSLSANFTVREVIELSIALEFPPLKTHALVNSILEDLALGELQNQPVDTLSGGQRHRTHLGRVLAQLKANKALGYDGYLFLDEPTASLDLAHQISVMKTARLVAKRGTGVMIVLHDLNLAAAYADRIALMKDGRVECVGTVEAVLTSQRLSHVYETSVSVGHHSNGQLSIQPEYIAA